MWTSIATGVGTLFKSWVGLKQAKLTAEAKYHENRAQAAEDWDVEAMRQAQYSIKDELIMGIWYSPLYVGWFYKSEDGWTLRSAEEWIAFVNLLPTWWWTGAFGIMAASFGLRWWFTDKKLKLGR